MKFVPDYSGGPVLDLHQVPFSSTHVDTWKWNTELFKQQAVVKNDLFFFQIPDQEKAIVAILESS